MKTAKDVLKSIKDNDVKYVDLRFTDPRGKWQHVTFDIGMIEEVPFSEGLMFDGSSIAGWKAINEFDMCLMPDPRHRDDRPVLRRNHHDPGLRRARADHRRALQPRPPWHRQEGGSHGEVDRASATPCSSAPRPSSSCSTTSVIPRVPTTPASGSTSPEFRDQLRYPRMKAAISVTASAPRPATSPCRRRTGAGHALRDARRDGQDGRQGREASPRGRFRPARARHEVRHA